MKLNFVYGQPSVETTNSVSRFKWACSSTLMYNQYESTGVQCFISACYIVLLGWFYFSFVLEKKLLLWLRRK